MPKNLGNIFKPVVLFGLITLFQLAYGQTANPTQNSPSQAKPADVPAVTDKAASSEGASQALRIGPGDELEITVFGAPDLSQRGRVSSAGDIFIPLVGAVHIAGETSTEAELTIAERLEHSAVVKHPQVSVYVKEYTNDEISVTGEVNKPGVYSALGPHRLFDILQTAGGLTDKAGSTITISHLANGEITTVELAKDPALMARANIELQPGDSIIVPKAGIVYVLGEVYRPGGYVMSSAGGYTVLQVIAAAGGPSHVASAGKTKMLRRGPNGVQQIPVPLQKLMEGKTADIPVEADDVLYVPSSRYKTILSEGALITSASQAAIYRLPY
jgi:polysaccharide export outer membrane protein